MNYTRDQLWIRARIFLIMGVIVLLWSGLIVRLYHLQVKSAPRLLEKAERQHEGLLKVEPRRGKILDRHGNILGLSIKVKSVFCVPHEVENIWVVAKELGAVLGLPKNRMIRQLSRKSKFAWIKRKISEEEQAKVEAMGFKGIYMLDEVKRVYPKDSLLCHVVGFVNIDNKGMMGIEASMDSVLKGTPGLAQVDHDARGKEIVASRVFKTKPKDGMDVILTIDEVIQSIVEEEADKVVEEFNPKGLSIIVMDVASNEILSMVSRPNFNLNNPGAFSQDSMRNRPISDVYEPGSLFKIVTAAAVLNERKTRLKEKIFCEHGAYRVAGLTLHDSHPEGTLTFAGVIAKSSNIGCAKVASRLSSKMLYKYIKNFGFGEYLGLPLKGETRGLIRHPKKWSGYSVAAIAMGHEILVSPVQIAFMVNTVANGGLKKPISLVKGYKNEMGENVPFLNKVEEKQIIRQETANKILKAMTLVPTDYGTASLAKIDGFLVGGKTGTAQKVVDGKYSHSKYLASFMGVIPGDKPKVTVTIMVDEPKGKKYGGSVAGPVFSRIGTRVMAYLKIMPQDNVNRKIEELLDQYAA